MSKHDLPHHKHCIAGGFILTNEEWVGEYPSLHPQVSIQGSRSEEHLPGGGFLAGEFSRSEYKLRAEPVSCRLETTIPSLSGYLR